MATATSRTKFCGKRIERSKIIPRSRSVVRSASRFEKIDELIIELTKTYEIAVGAVAWLTNPDILAAMAG